MSKKSIIILLFFLLIKISFSGNDFNLESSDLIRIESGYLLELKYCFVDDNPSHSFSKDDFLDSKSSHASGNYSNIRTMLMDDVNHNPKIMIKPDVPPLPRYVVEIISLITVKTNIKKAQEIAKAALTENPVKISSSQQYNIQNGKSTYKMTLDIEVPIVIRQNTVLSLGATEFAIDNRKYSIQPAKIEIKAP